MPKLRYIRLTALLLVVLIAMVQPANADPLVGGCQVFPLSNPWNMDVSDAPVNPNSANYIANINANDVNNTKVHPDFGENPTYGIPYTTVNGNTQGLVPINFNPNGSMDESDPGPTDFHYPIPGDAPVEGTDDPNNDGDRHVLVVDTDNCILYELYRAFPAPSQRPATSWTVDSTAIWDLNSSVVQQRPLGWTSADAAGLPIFPGLARCDEAMTGTIKHAFRFTVSETREAYVFPASHLTYGNTGANYPPMGLRFRLKANYDLSSMMDGQHPQALAIAQALKTYGMMIADNGSNWYISGEADRNNCWDDTDLDALKAIPGTAFEVVDIVSAPTAAPVRNYYLTSDVVLRWMRVTWATGYEVQVSKNSAFTGASIIPQTADQLSYTYTASPLTNGTYYWRVRATGGAGTWSSVESFIVHAP